MLIQTATPSANGQVGQKFLFAGVRQNGRGSPRDVEYRVWPTVNKVPNWADWVPKNAGYNKISKGT